LLAKGFYHCYSVPTVNPQSSSSSGKTGENGRVLGMTAQSNFTKGVLQMVNLLKNLHKEESGQDLIEYALIGLIVALGAIAGMGNLASSINKEFTKIASQLS